LSHPPLLATKKTPRSKVRKQTQEETKGGGRAIARLIKTSLKKGPRCHFLDLDVFKANMDSKVIQQLSQKAPKKVYLQAS